MSNWIAVGVFVLLPLLPVISNDAYAQESAEAGRKVVAKVVPQYPGLARSMRIQGNVRADVLVAANGKVKSVEMKGGHPLLVQSAEDALRQWKWEPSSHDSHEIVELRFTP
jgi:TonB family protein